MKLIKRNNYQPSFPSFFDDIFTKDLFGMDRDFSPFKSNPAVNIKENDESFKIEVAAPGLKKEDFNVELDQNVLTISFEQKGEKEEKDEKEKFTRREFSYSSFKRSFTIPENVVNAEEINAQYNDGILSLHLPKKEEAKVQAKRLIEIQ